MHLPPRIQYHIFLICTLLYSTNCSFIFYTLQVYTEDYMNDYISLTDIAKYKNEDDPRFVIQNWMRNRNTLEFIGLW